MNTRLSQAVAISVAAAATIGAVRAPAHAQHEQAVARRLQPYWTRHVYAVQPRAVPKARRLELAALAGVIPTDPIRVYVPLGGRATFHLAERWAVSGDFAYYLSARTALASSLGADSGSDPSRWQREQQRWRAAGLLLWSPLYGKLSVYGRVVQLELYLLGGGGVLHTLENRTLGAASGVRPLVELGGGCALLLKERWLLRLEYRQHLYLRPSAVGGLGWPAEVALGGGVLLGRGGGEGR